MNNPKSEKITCDVTNCVYHSGATHCTANTVKVGPENACRCEQTCCASFKEKNTTQKG